MSADGRGYEFFDHTADVGLRASGATVAELFTRVAQGFTALIAEEVPLRPSESREVRLDAPTVDALLRTWLNELLLWFDTDRFLPGAFALESPTETALRGRVQGERFDPSRHRVGTEIKGITRHQFRVERRGGRWEAQVIFDV